MQRMGISILAYFIQEDYLNKMKVKNTILLILLFSSIIIIIGCSKTVAKTPLEFQKELWQIITRRFDYSELEALIAATYNNQLINWDYEYFYELPNFNLRIYLQNFSEFVSWKELSVCKKLEISFRYDERELSEVVWRKDIIQLLEKRITYMSQDIIKIDKLLATTLGLPVEKHPTEQGDRRRNGGN